MNSFTVAEHLDVSAVASLMVCFLQNPGSSSAHIDVGQICYVPDDVFMITLIKRWKEKRCSTHVKTVAKEIMKVESSKQIRSQTCCSVTIDSKNHLLCQLMITQSFKKMRRPF